MSDLISWDKIMELALSLPGVKVDRKKFLNDTFCCYCNESWDDTKRPIDILEIEIIEKDN